MNRQTQAKLQRRVQAEREALIERLKEIRGERSQLEFAHDLGVYQQNINRYERGIAVPHADFLIRLALHEKVNLNWLLLGKGRGFRRAA